MENWGLVMYVDHVSRRLLILILKYIFPICSYRESLLLFDYEKSLIEDEYMSLLVIAHEISHSVSKCFLSGCVIG